MKFNFFVTLDTVLFYALVVKSLRLRAEFESPSQLELDNICCILQGVNSQSEAGLIVLAFIACTLSSKAKQLQGQCKMAR